APPLRIDAEGAIATAFKPSDDGRAWILRLFGASGRNERVSLVWAGPKPARVYWSDTSERPLRPVEGEIVVPAWGLVTLRSEK
ncbi:MAG: glycosyl hydrolase-related protein, partial [Planctomycetota bacterium]